MKELRMISLDSKDKVIYALRHDFQLKIRKLEAEKDLLVNEKKALMTKVALLERQLESQEETIRLQLKLFEEEKKTLECRKALDIMRQQPTISQHQLNELEWGNIRINSKPEMMNSRGIKLEHKSEKIILPMLSKFQLPLSPESPPPKPTVVLQKKRKNFNATDEQWVSPRRKKKEARVEGSLKVTPNGSRYRAAPSSERKNMSKLTGKKKVLKCFSQLQDYTGTLHDVFRLMNQFGKYNRSTVSGEVSNLFRVGILQKVQCDESRLTVYRMSRLKEN